MLLTSGMCLHVPLITRVKRLSKLVTKLSATCARHAPASSPLEMRTRRFRWHFSLDNANACSSMAYPKRSCKYREDTWENGFKGRMGRCQKGRPGCPKSAVFMLRSAILLSYETLSSRTSSTALIRSRMLNVSSACSSTSCGGGSVSTEIASSCVEFHHSKDHLVFAMFFASKCREYKVSSASTRIRMLLSSCAGRPNRPPLCLDTLVGTRRNVKLGGCVGDGFHFLVECGGHTGGLVSSGGREI